MILIINNNSSNNNNNSNNSNALRSLPLRSDYFVSWVACSIAGLYSEYWSEVLPRPFLGLREAEG